MNYKSGEDSDSGIKIYLREIGQIPLPHPAAGDRTRRQDQKGDREAARLDDPSNLRLVVRSPMITPISVCRC
jgi:hypothetical protein